MAQYSYNTVGDINRPDYRIIIDLIEPGARVLDLGCGGGELLDHLVRKRNAQGQGVEIDPANINQCVARGVPAIQGDVDEGLQDYQDQSFDYVVLNQTLQVVKAPERVLREMVRVGRQAVVGFPNYGHYAIRLKLLLTGRMPQTAELPEHWYDSPNIHPFTILDFEELCWQRGITIVKRFLLSRRGVLSGKWFPDWRAVQAVYLLRKEA